MESTDSFSANLGEILDRIGPGAFLHIDATWMEPLFGNWTTEAAKLESIQAATDFAKKHACGFQFDETKQQGVFLRAYFPRSN